MNNAGNVSTGKPNKIGGVYLAPLGTDLPTDAKTKLSDEFVNIGYISTDGMTNTIDNSVSNILEWGGNTVLMTEESFAETFAVNAIETNPASLAAYYGAENVIVGENGAIEWFNTANVHPHQVAVFEIAMDGDKVLRIVVPDAQLGDRSGDISYTATDAIAYPLSLTGLIYVDEELGREYTSHSMLASLKDPVVEG